MYDLKYSAKFKRKLKKLFIKGNVLKSRVQKTLGLLKTNPFYPSLKSHKVIAVDGKSGFSSRATSDIRIIWRFSAGQACVIDVTDIGGHEGKDGVYR